MLENTLKVIRSQERGNATIFALIAVLVVALGGGAFYMMQKEPSDSSVAAKEAAAEPASGDASKAADTAKADNKGDAPKIDIKPGNPVVAKINGKDITRVDVLNFIQNLSPQVRQMPIEQLFPLALEQVVNSELISDKVKGVNLDEDPMVKKELEVAKSQIVRQVFMQKEADKAITDDLLKTAYEEYKKNFPKMEEVKARHILVKDEALANDLIKQIKGGADFAELAKKNSIDATKDNGGELNYVIKQDVVPAFSDVVFAMNKGDLTSKPIKTDFGYHVVELMDKRERQPATFEQVKPFLTAQLRGEVLNTVVQKWRDAAKVEMFDINGDPAKPAAAPTKAN